MKGFFVVALLMSFLLIAPGCTNEESDISTAFVGPSEEFATPSAAEKAYGNPRIIPPHARPFGKTYGEWSIDWWQWLVSAPFDQNPGLDETGEFVSWGQSGPVWFIASNFGGESVRNAVIPTGKSLFIFLMGFEASTLEGHGETIEELRALADWVTSGIENLACEIDGVPVENLDQYRVASPTAFSLDVPENSIFFVDGLTVEPGTYFPSVSDGYYLMLPPLSRGEHTIHISGEQPDLDGFWQDVTINLTVEGGRGTQQRNSH